MNYDNDRDRTKYGYDAGNIVDGKVVYDVSKAEYVLVDDEGVGFSIQDVLKQLEGKRVRLTCISFESMEHIEKLMAQTQAQTEPSH